MSFIIRVVIIIIIFIIAIVVTFIKIFILIENGSLKARTYMNVKTHPNMKINKLYKVSSMKTKQRNRDTNS